MTRRAWATLLLLILHTVAAAGQGPEDRPPEFAIDHDANRVVRRDAAGKVRWATHLGGYLGLVRPPHLLWDARRVYVTHGDGVTALDAETGKVVWHARGPHDRLCLSGGLLLAVDCGLSDDIEARGRSFTARAVTGREVFRVRLPQPTSFDPEDIREVAGLFLVQVWEGTDGRGDARLIDRRGEVRYRLDRQVVAGLQRGDDRVLLTSRDVVRLSAEGKRLWAARFDWEWAAGGGLLALPGGDLVAFLYGGIADSGVQLARLDPATGKVRWRACCDGLGVTHSEYEHEAAVAVEGGRLRVTRRGSGGTFTELLDLRSGRRLGRTQHIDEAYEEP